MRREEEKKRKCDYYTLYVKESKSGENMGS